MNMGKIVIIFLKIIKRVSSLFKMYSWKLLYFGSFQCGRNTYFYPRTHIVIDSKGKIVIGENCFFNCNCSINSMLRIEIGDDCIFGENVCIYDHNHQYKKENIEIRKQGFDKKKVLIGNNCWIGSNVTILAGVQIGNNVVIGAGVVVTKSIPDNSVVVSSNKITYLK